MFTIKTFQKYCLKQNNFSLSFSSLQGMNRNYNKIGSFFFFLGKISSFFNIKYNEAPFMAQSDDYFMG